MSFLVRVKDWYHLPSEETRLYSTSIFCRILHKWLPEWGFSRQPAHPGWVQVNICPRTQIVLSLEWPLKRGLLYCVKGV